MRIWNKRLLLVCLVAVPAFGQEVKLQLDIEGELSRAQREVAGLDQKLAMTMQNLGFDAFQARGGAFGYTGGGGYEAATRLLDERKYDEAIKRFDSVIASKSDRADGALYWKAYALNRIGRRDEALATIAALRRDYPNSHWLNDAQALEVELKTNSGRPVSPADESNDDIKLIAINALMNAAPEQAIPLLDGLLKGTAAPKVKDRAMFVLTQNRSPRAQQILAEYAKGAGNPDLQLRAVRYVGMSGTAEAQQQLATIYAASSDVAVKREIIRSLMIAGASDKLLELARNEKNGTLRMEAIRNLSLTPNVTADTLTSLYTTDSDAQIKREVVNALHVRGDAKGLIALARKEPDAAMKAYIVKRLATMRNSKEATDYMVELLK